MKSKSFAGLVAVSALLFTKRDAAVAAAVQQKGVKELTGAGATFPYPLYSKMFSEYDKALRGEGELSIDRLGRRHSTAQGTDGRFRRIGWRHGRQAESRSQGWRGASYPDRGRR